MTAQPAIELDLPPDFYEVPIESSVEDRVAGQSVILDRLRIDDRSQREGVGWYLEALSRSVRLGNVAGTAFCAVRLDGAPSTATLTAAVQDSPSDDPLVFALGASQILARSGRFTTVSQENLGGVVAAVGSGATGDVRFVTIVLPLVGHRSAVIVTLSTTDAAHAAIYETIARTAAASVRVAT